MDVLCNMQDKAGIPAIWMLLDSQSTMDVFCNTEMLTNIHDMKRHLVLHCNAGTTSVTKKVDLKGYWTVWYHPNDIVNILSLINVKKKYRVTFDSNKGNGSQCAFKPSKKELYYLEVTNDIQTTSVTTVDSVKINTLLYSTLVLKHSFLTKYYRKT